MEFEVLLNKITNLEKRLTKVEDMINKQITGWEDTDTSKKTVGWKASDIRKEHNAKQKGYTGW